MGKLYEDCGHIRLWARLERGEPGLSLGDGPILGPSAQWLDTFKEGFAYFSNNFLSIRAR